MVVSTRGATNRPRRNREDDLAAAAAADATDDDEELLSSSSSSEDDYDDSDDEDYVQGRGNRRRNKKNKRKKKKKRSKLTMGRRRRRDDDDHDEQANNNNNKRRRLMKAAKKLPPIETLPAEVWKKVLLFLDDAREIYNLAIHQSNKMLHRIISNDDEIVIRSAIFSGGVPQDAMSCGVMSLVQQRSIYVPETAMRLLRLANATMCERVSKCYGFNLSTESSTNIRKSEKRPFGMAICPACVKVVSASILPNYGRKRQDHFALLCQQDTSSCVAVCDRTRVMIKQSNEYATNNRIGPYVFSRDIKQIENTYGYHHATTTTVTTNNNNNNNNNETDNDDDDDDDGAAAAAAAAAGADGGGAPANNNHGNGNTTTTTTTTTITTKSDSTIALEDLLHDIDVQRCIATKSAAAKAGTSTTTTTTAGDNKEVDDGDDDDDDDDDGSSSNNNSSSKKSSSSSSSSIDDDNIDDSAVVVEDKVECMLQDEDDRVMKLVTICNEAMSEYDNFSKAKQQVINDKRTAKRQEDITKRITAIRAMYDKISSALQEEDENGNTYEHKDHVLECEWEEDIDPNSYQYNRYYFRFKYLPSKMILGQLFAEPNRTSSANKIANAVALVKEAYILLHNNGFLQANYVERLGDFISQHRAGRALQSYCSTKFPTFQDLLATQHGPPHYYFDSTASSLMTPLRLGNVCAVLCEVLNEHGCSYLKEAFVDNALTLISNTASEARKNRYKEAAERIWNRDRNRPDNNGGGGGINGQTGQPDDEYNKFKARFNRCRVEFQTLVANFRAYRRQPDTVAFLNGQENNDNNGGPAPIRRHGQTNAVYKTLTDGRGEDLLRNRQMAELLSLHRRIYHNPREFGFYR